VRPLRPPENIALLTPRSSERSALWRVDELGGVKLTDDPLGEGKILRSSIQRFKVSDASSLGSPSLTEQQKGSLHRVLTSVGVPLGLLSPLRAQPTAGGAALVIGLGEAAWDAGRPSPSPRRLDAVLQLYSPQTHHKASQGGPWRAETACSSHGASRTRTGDLLVRSRIRGIRLSFEAPRIPPCFAGTFAHPVIG
jgi:hypothetical protein